MIVIPLLLLIMIKDFKTEDDEHSDILDERQYIVRICAILRN